MEFTMSRRHPQCTRLVRLVFAGLLAGAAALPSSPAAAGDLLIFAAASLKNALDDAEAIYQQESGSEVITSYAASGPLAKQIESGAPADLFISADLDWMDYVEGKGVIKANTRVNLLGNRLVLVAPAANIAQLENSRLEIGPGFALASALGAGRLAIGDPQSVPAGKYGQGALEKLGVWKDVENRTARADSVRAALLLVSRGEAPLGIVYETDAVADKGVTVVGVFPEDTHPPIIYPIAITAASRNPEAPKFLAWLRSPAAAPVFEKQGFQVLK
jgi:molybdate transport system substrate-binding protein